MGKKFLRMDVQRFGMCLCLIKNGKSSPLKNLSGKDLRILHKIIPAMKKSILYQNGRVSIKASRDSGHEFFLTRNMSETSRIRVLELSEQGFCQFQSFIDASKRVFIPCLVQNSLQYRAAFHLSKVSYIFRPLHFSASIRQRQWGYGASLLSKHAIRYRNKL